MTGERRSPEGPENWCSAGLQACRVGQIYGSAPHQERFFDDSQGSLRRTSRTAYGWNKKGADVALLHPSVTLITVPSTGLRFVILLVPSPLR